VKVDQYSFLASSREDTMAVWIALGVVFIGAFAAILAASIARRPKAHDKQNKE